MQLAEVVSELSSELPACGDYRVVVIGRKRQSPSDEWGEIEAFDVLDVLVDDDDKDINLLTSENGAEENEGATVHRVSELLVKLRSLEQRCSTWSVFAASGRVSIGSKWEARVDVPLVGVATNHAERVYAFLQWPREQWETAV